MLTLALHARAQAPAPAAAASASAPSEMAAARRMAADRGCYNCHGTSPRADAPAFKLLAERLANKPDAQRHVLEEMRETAIIVHQETAPADQELLVRWLASGAK